jgi:serine-type D-Ala-D-Ala carboxypeptidase/endopeptidase (penicillin-binding protein 4)
MTRAALFVVLLSACAALPAVSERMEQERRRGSTVAWLVVDAQTGKTLSESDAHRRMLPASVTKLASTLAALQVFGPEHRFVTPFFLDSPPAPQWRGNLVLIPSHDPSFASDRFDETRDTLDRIAAAMSALGIKRWRGGVIVDGGDAALYGPGWSQDDLGSEYTQPQTRFLFAENTKKARVSRHTQSSDAMQISLVEGSKSSSACRRAPYATYVSCEVTLAPGQDETTVSFADVDPERSFAQALDAALATHGIAHEGDAVPLRNERIALVEIRSPQLSTLVAVTNKHSLNVYADALLFAVNARTQRPRTFTDAVQSLLEVLKEAGVMTSGVRLTDGSGLSRYDALTPSFMVSLLRTGLGLKESSAWISSFAIAGVDGTLKRRALPQATLVFAKTGTLSAQRALAGIAYRPHHADHPLVAFALFIDHDMSDQTNALLDDFLRRVVD